ncbi:ferritin-like domain-containing protein [Corallococcus exiguus]|uniref:Ferritin-like domain-containing protein n=1 Tax=Corallococcus exiguus TaxID=83462 RepID=A0A7X4YJ54_9BACT|nr:ferritin-like domain-containing protein [Corallococcus exiguus]NBC46226.1 ferritin-like domain-containing protein [Corallococcus exiguus]TNV65227.1 ferritin-like domain-containing protein [Corallococcus exiguus]
MNVDRLRLLFSRALRVSLATPLLLTGCQGEPVVEPPPKAEPAKPGPTKPEPADLSQHSDVACVDGFPALTGLTVAPAPDVLQLRTVRRWVPPSLPPIELKASEGEPCATASNPQACLNQLDALDVTRGFPRICGYSMECAEGFLATTRGDEVATYTTADAVRALLGSIDTPEEASLLAYASGYALCSHPAYERGKVRALPDGTFSVVSIQDYDCETNVYETRHDLKVTQTGVVTEEGTFPFKEGKPDCVVGRRPVGLQRGRAGDCEDARGGYFANAARLEAAAIHAFLRLRDELALHGASNELQDAALASAQDEVRHTEVTLRLAHRFGATPVPPTVTALPLRSLSEVLLDNTVEGCVRETYGALVAHHQALHACDPGIRKAMARIADDETRHAGLSWDIDAWATPNLPTEAQAVLHAARRQAIAVLRAEVAVPLDPELTADAGLPSPDVASALLDSLEQSLWA